MRKQSKVYCLLVEYSILISELIIIMTNVIAVNHRLFDSSGQEIEFLEMNTCHHPNRG